MKRNRYAKKRQYSKRRKHSRYPYIIGISIILIAFVVGRQWSASDADVRSSVVGITGAMELCLTTSTDTIVVERYAIAQQGVWAERHWWWPSCRGRVLTPQFTDYTLQHAENDGLTNEDWTAWLDVYAKSTDAAIAQKEIEQKEQAYYLRSHGVQDEGYTRIAEYAQQTNMQLDSLRQSKKQHQAFGTPKKARLMSRYKLNVNWWDEDGQRHTAPCRTLVTEPTTQPKTMMVQTVEGKKPSGVYSVRHQYWGDVRPKEVATANLVASDSALMHRVLVAKGKMATDSTLSLPTLFTSQGAAVFTTDGKFVGLATLRRLLIK